MLTTLYVYLPLSVDLIHDHDDGDEDVNIQVDQEAAGACIQQQLATACSSLSECYVTALVQCASRQAGQSESRECYQRLFTNQSSDSPQHRRHWRVDTSPDKLLRLMIRYTGSDTTNIKL